MMLSPDGAPVKIWSVIVTLFGDLASGEGDEISGACLGVLMEPLGFKPDATRVALHRLRKDGWIEVRKQGRQAHYRLSAFGLRETAKASPRIYSAPKENASIKIFALPDGEETEGYVQLAPSLFAARNLPADAFQLLQKDEALPQWVRDNILAPTLIDAFKALQTGIAQTRTAPSTPVDCAIKRATIIHPWRRLILRVSQEAEILLGQCEIQSCRKAVMAALESTPRPSLTNLHEAV